MKALILTDIQNDFLPGGALAVPHGDEIIPVANKLAPLFDLVVATQDWHGPRHGSFAQTHGKALGDMIELAGVPQRLWPVHCVQNSHGAKLSPRLDQRNVHEVVHKGVDDEVDSYSAFFDNARRRETRLDALLREYGVDELYIMGLATDYCVRATALDAMERGFRTHVVIDGCRGIEANPGDIDRAVAEMKSAGVDICTSDQVE